MASNNFEQAQREYLRDVFGDQDLSLLLPDTAVDDDVESNFRDSMSRQAQEELEETTAQQRNHHDDRYDSSQRGKRRCDAEPRHRQNQQHGADQKIKNDLAQPYQ